MGIVDSFHNPSLLASITYESNLARSIKLKLNFDGQAEPVPRVAIFFPARPKDLGMCVATDADRLKSVLFKSVLNCCATEPVTWSVALVPCQRSVRTFRDCNDGTEPEPCGLAIFPNSDEISYSSEVSEENSYGSEENCNHYYSVPYRIHMTRYRHNIGYEIRYV